MKARWAWIFLAAFILTALFSLSAIAQTQFDPAIAVTVRASVRGTTTDQLAVMNADGSNLTVLFTVPLATPPSWRPAKMPIHDSTGMNIIGYEYQMIITYMTDWTPRMVTFDVINNAVQNVTIDLFVPNQGCHFYHAAWSPDGKWIAISTSAGVYVVQPDGTTGLTRVVAGCPKPTWSPDSTSIAYDLNFGTSIVRTRVIDSSNIPILNADEVPGNTLTVISGAGESPAWSPSGNWIAYWNEQDKKNALCIYIVPATGGGTPQAMPSTSKAGSWTTWPDKDDAFIYNDNGRIVKQSMVNGVGTGQVTVLAAAKNTTFYAPVWRRGATTSP